MDLDTLTALQTEKIWEEDSVPVLRAAVSLPQTDGRGRRARRFNRYYRRFLRAFLLYCEHALLPEARASLHAALSASLPFSPRQVTLRFTVTWRGGDLLSLVLDAEEPGLTVRRADTWDLASGLPVPLSEFFPPKTPLRTRLGRAAREELARRQERSGTLWREDSRRMLRRALNTRNFYLSEGGLCFFYPMYALADASAGIVTFTLPYDAADGPFPPVPPA